MESAFTSMYKSLQECIDGAKPMLLNDYAPINTRYVQSVHNYYLITDL